MKRKILVILGLSVLVAVAMTGCTIGPEDPAPPVEAAEDTVSAEAAALVTITAAPSHTLPTPTVDPNATEEPAASGSSASYDPAMVAQGQADFSAICSACHGMDALGLPNLGKDLVHSEFAKGLTDDDLVNFIVTGRPIWDPLNTTGVDMPPKGGNPALSVDQIKGIVAYIRTLEAAAGN